MKITEISTSFDIPSYEGYNKRSKPFRYYNSKKLINNVLKKRKNNKRKLDVKI